MQAKRGTRGRRRKALWRVLGWVLAALVLMGAGDSCEEGETKRVLDAIDRWMERQSRLDIVKQAARIRTGNDEVDAAIDANALKGFEAAETLANEGLSRRDFALLDRAVEVSKNDYAILGKRGALRLYGGGSPEEDWRRAEELAKRADEERVAHLRRTGRARDLSDTNEHQSENFRLRLQVLRACAKREEGPGQCSPEEASRAAAGYEQTRRRMIDQHFQDPGGLG